LFRDGFLFKKDRVQILRTITKERPRLASDVDLEVLGRDARCNGFSGADLTALVREAALAALSQSFAANPTSVPKVDLFLIVVSFPEEKKNRLVS
jgi:SpoVK/Ycf46/Vps4 family AAA+-type ATPase